MSCICPLVKEKCIGKKCCEFVPRHTYIGKRGYGIQHLCYDIYAWIFKKPYYDDTYIGTICAHCNQGYRSAERYNKPELTEDWAHGKS